MLCSKDLDNLKPGHIVGVAGTHKPENCFCSIHTVVKVTKQFIQLSNGEKFRVRDGQEWGSVSYSARYLISHSDAIQWNLNATELQIIAKAREKIIKFTAACNDVSTLRKIITHIDEMEK